MDLTHIRLMDSRALLQLVYDAPLPVKRSRRRPATTRIGSTTLVCFMVNEASGWGVGVVRRWQYQVTNRIEGVTFAGDEGGLNKRIVEIEG